MDEYEIGSLYQISAVGYDKFHAVHLGRITANELRIGDYIRILAMGGYFDSIVRIGYLRFAANKITVVFDWNQWRDGRPGGSLLPDEIVMEPGDMCREVWRPED